MSVLSSQRAELRKQLDAAPWLKWALTVAVLLVAALIWQGLETLRAKVQEAAIDEEVKLHRIRGLEGQDVWMQRAQQADETLQALQAEIPTVATAGLAQAALQSWLRELAAGVSDDQNLRVVVDSAAPLEVPPDVLRVHATVSGALAPRQALSLVRSIESATQLMLIETLEIRGDSSKSANIGLNAYYRLGTADHAAPGDGAPASVPATGQEEGK